MKVDETNRKTLQILRFNLISVSEFCLKLFPQSSRHRDEIESRFKALCGERGGSLKSIYSEEGMREKSSHALSHMKSFSFVFGRQVVLLIESTSEELEACGFFFVGKSAGCLEKCAKVLTLAL